MIFFVKFLLKGASKSSFFCVASRSGFGAENSVSCSVEKFFCVKGSLRKSFSV